jgi:prephenate dehydrogenase
MNKIAILGLGLVGNSIGMGLKKAMTGDPSVEVVGFDPDRGREEVAMRRYSSVDAIAPDLESAVRGANLVVIATPGPATREVLEAIGPFLDEGATVTDTLPTKEQVMAWAGELLGNRASFVGGHPMSRTLDLETATDLDEPRADLFNKAPYCIIPLPSADSDALNRVIFLAETLGARPLFIDPREHDSYFAAVSGLPVIASAALLRITATSPSWQDMGALARDHFKSVSEPLADDPQVLRETLLSNRQTLLHWLDQYLLALQDVRDLLAQGQGEALLALLQEANSARQEWVIASKRTEENASAFSARQTAADDHLRQELHETIRDSQPFSARRLFGKAISDRMFGERKDK